MSETVGEGIIRIRTDETGVDYNAAGASAGQGYSRGFAGSLKGIVAAIGGVIAAKKVLDFTKQSVAEAREAQKVGAATEQIIKATGSAAGVTAKQVGDLVADDPQGERLIANLRTGLALAPGMEGSSAAVLHFDAQAQCLVAALSQPQQRKLETLLATSRAAP